MNGNCLLISLNDHGDSEGDIFILGMYVLFPVLGPVITSASITLDPSLETEVKWGLMVFFPFGGAGSLWWFKGLQYTYRKLRYCQSSCFGTHFLIYFGGHRCSKFILRYFFKFYVEICFIVEMGLFFVQC